MQSILVTGGAGFVGGTFVRRLLDTTEAVIVDIDRLTYAGNLTGLEGYLNNPRLQFVRGDVADSTLLARLFEEYRFDCVVNFAAESSVDRSIGNPLKFAETNVIGTLRLLDSVLEYWASLEPARQSRFRFLQASTFEVYGSLGPQGVFTESAPYAPSSPYAASKAAADHFVRSYHRTYGLPALIACGTSNYGPYQLPERLIPLVTLNALERYPLPVYGDGQNVREWCHVEDHCGGLVRILEAGVPGQTYHLGGGFECTNLELVRMVCAAVDRLRPHAAPAESLIRFVSDRPGHDARSVLSDAKVARELGWRPNISFADGLEETVRWYVYHAEQGVFDQVLHRKRQGLSREAVAILPDV